MLIELVLDALYGIFSLLTTPIDIPNLPEGVHDALETAFGYLEAGAGIVANYVNLPFLVAVFGIIIAVDVGIHLYHFVMWILRKIPMLGIE